MNPEADFDSYIKTLRKSLENDGLEQKIAEGWDEGRREKAGLRSLHGDLGQPRVRAVISVGQAWIGAEQGLSIEFANLDYMLQVGFFCIDFDCCFQPRTENETPRALHNRNFDASNLPPCSSDLSIEIYNASTDSQEDPELSPPTPIRESNLRYRGTRQYILRRKKCQGK